MAVAVQDETSEREVWNETSPERSQVANVENPFNSALSTFLRAGFTDSIIIKLVFHLWVLYTKRGTQLGSVFIKVQKGNSITQVLN